MLKQSSSMKKGIAVSLAVLFAVSLTAVAASAHHGGGGYGGCGGSGLGCYYVNGMMVCPGYGGYGLGYGGSGGGHGEHHNHDKK